MAELVRRMPWPEPGATSGDALITREWLVTNGLGGYASGTVAGIITRRFHGYLVAALPNPLGRVMMLNEVVEQFALPNGQCIQLAGEERAGSPLKMHGADYLTEFRLDSGLPVWHYRVDGFLIEKRLMLPHRQNTVYVCYRILDGEGTVKLSLRPSVNIRPHEAPVSAPITRPYMLTVVEDQYEIIAQDLPPLRMILYGRGAALTIDRLRTQEIVYRIEESRGYEARGDLWSPGYFQTEIARGQEATLVASTEPWEVVRALSPLDAWDNEFDRRNRLLADADPAVHEGAGAELVLAADQFIIRPAGRLADTARAQAAGDEVRTVIAGYHWFTDWGRDTMISLEGLTLTTGRHVEASYILRTFAHYVRDGLIPNMFPEGEKEGLYHTADATLWFFHAIDRYVELTGDRTILRLVLPKLLDIVDHHLKGTRFGIHVDASDDLLVQGAQGYQLTWMDAKVGDWVVTPRRGKAVEINALWYNALRLLEQWLVEENRPDAVPSLQQHSERTWHSFNRRFWNEATGYLFDVIDTESGGNDESLRPNQLLAISLKYPVLDRVRWKPVVDVCNRELVTPVGLRSLGRNSPDYKPRYDGDLRARDAAYHQGTVWAWLIGPFIDAWLKVYPDNVETARRCVEGFTPHLGEACIGSISEIFDAEPPYTPRGCIAQAWSVAEVLRCTAKVADFSVSRMQAPELANAVK
ncbi:MAG TPA: amylo-alpha-1,6-glucosidase [Bryobacteraceae bacterium]|nr:amylo-alpha-1,6-glucosidase [Bryobacteraceae bacterium]